MGYIRHHAIVVISRAASRQSEGCGLMLRALWQNLLAVLVGVRPDVAEAVRQQRAVTQPKGPHTRRIVTPEEAQARRFAPVPLLVTGGYGEWRAQWGNARMLGEAELYGAAAVQMIAASGNGTARVVEEEHA